MAIHSQSRDVPEDTIEIEDVSENGRQSEASTSPYGRRGGRERLSGGGAFLLILFVTTLACIGGFLATGATYIPPATAWGLLGGALIAAFLVRKSGRATVIWSPPVAMAIVVLGLGQITLLGATPTVARELSMFLSAMSSSAPLQLGAIVAAFVILKWRFPKQRKSPVANDKDKTADL